MPRSPAGNGPPANVVRAYDSRRPATPAAWPVFSEPVEPISTMSALPPYWVRLELRKKLVVKGCALGVTPIPARPSRSCWQPSANSSGGAAGFPNPGRPPGPEQVPFGAVSGKEPAT